MNRTEYRQSTNINSFQRSSYEALTKQKVGMLSMLHGTVETYASTFTVQFNDYTKYHAAGLGGEARIAHQAEQFPKDLQAAYDMGKRLVTLT